MSSQRYISTSFWDDAWIQELDPSEKLLYIYLLTNPLTNIAGVYKITRRRICFDTGFNSDTVGHILSKFEKAQKVFEFGEYIILKNWCKNQNVDSKDNKSNNVKKGIDNILMGLPEEVLIKVVEVGYNYKYLAEILKLRGIKPLEAPLRPSNYSNSDSYLNSNADIYINSNAASSPEESDSLSPEETSSPVVENNNLSEPRENYAKIIFDLWTNNDLEMPGSKDIISFMQKDFPKGLENLRGIHSDDVIQACKNYFEILNSNSYYSKNKYSFGMFTKGHIEHFLPMNYIKSKFLNDKPKKPDKNNCDLNKPDEANPFVMT